MIIIARIAQFQILYRVTFNPVLKHDPIDRDKRNGTIFAGSIP